MRQIAAVTAVVLIFFVLPFVYEAGHKSGEESAMQSTPIAKQQSGAEHTAQTTLMPAGNNLLEEAVDPNTGSREKWSKFTDEGGLNNNNYFYGMPVQEVNAQWNADKSIHSVFMYVSKAISPKTIREALNIPCGTNEVDWTKEDGSVTSGDAQNGKIKCNYFTNNTASEYDVSISVAH